MSEVIADLLEGETLRNKVGCTGMAQGVGSTVRGMDPEIHHAFAGHIMETSSGHRPEGRKKSKEYLTFGTGGAHFL